MLGSRTFFGISPVLGSDFFGVCLVLAITTDEPPKDVGKWLSLLTRGFLRITAQETLSSTRKAIYLHLFVVVKAYCVSFIMAWAKQAADAGVAGMQEREVVQGVIEGSVDVTLPDIPEVQFIKVVSRSTSIYLSM